MERLLKLASLFLTISILKHSVSCIHLPLKKTVNFNQGSQIDQLVALDRVRHAHLYNSTANFPLQGSLNAKLYTTTVKLGTPVQELTVQIDTGSNYVWVACDPCNTCPISNKSTLFDPFHSSTAIKCENRDDCYYKNEYVDTSGYSGYYVRDIWEFNSHPLGSNSPSVEKLFSAPIRFGCTTKVKGGLAENYTADGVFGFGMGQTSALSQLSALHVTPMAFAHCLTGDGGGSLAIGEVLAPNMVYSRLLRSQSSYSLNLMTIGVNDQIIDVHPYVTEGPAAIDSGTTLAYLVHGVFAQFVDMINDQVSAFATPLPANKGKQCYHVGSKSNRAINIVFPKISLNFDGDASMVLNPKQYLKKNDSANSSNNNNVWCLGFHGSSSSTILGDIVLRDKIIAYDPVRERIGWTDYDCSSPMSLSNQYSGSKRVHPQIMLTALGLGIVAFL